MLRLNRVAPALAGFLAFVSLAPAAFAETPAEIALKDLVAGIDASPDWAAKYGSITADAANETATLSGLEITSEGNSAGQAAAVKVNINAITVGGYAAIMGGGFAAKHFGVTGMTVDAGILKVAIDDVAFDDVAIPPLPAMAYDTTKPFTSIMRFYDGVLKVKIGKGRIGSLAIIETLMGVSTRVSYENFQINDFANGKIASVSTGALRLETPSPEGLVSMKVGGVEAKGIDLGGFVHVYNPDNYQNGVGDMVWQSVLASGSYNDAEIEVPGARVAVKRIGIENFRLRQPTKPFTGLFDTMMSRMSSGDENDPMQALQAVGQAVAMVTAVGFGRFSVEGVSVDATGVNSFTLDDFHIADVSSDAIGEIAVNGLNGSVQGQGSIKIGRLAVGGIVFPPLGQLLGTMAAGMGGDDEGVNPLAMLPKLGFAEAAGIDFASPDVPHFKLDKFRLDISNYVGAVPTSVAADLTDFELPVSMMKADARASLRRLGYDRLSASYHLKYGWDESAKMFSLDNFSFGIAGMGTISASAKIVGISRDALENFANPEAFANAALASAQISFKDESIVTKSLALLAERMKVPPAKFRQQFADALPFLLSISPIQDPRVLAIVKQSGLLAKLAPAVKTFVAAPGTFTIDIAPATPVLLSQINEATEKAPETLPSLLNLTLTAIPGPPPTEAEETLPPAETDNTPPAPPDQGDQTDQSTGDQNDSGPPPPPQPGPPPPPPDQQPGLTPVAPQDSGGLRPTAPAQ